MNKCGYLGWNEYALTCWFTEYLPDFNHRNQELLRTLIADALWWADTFDLDGFRVDATKHIESNYLRLLRRSLDLEIGGKTAPFYMVGENFLYDYGIINEKIGPHELQGQFDFPLYGAIRTALIPGNSDLAYLNSFVYNSFVDFQGITDLRWSTEGPTTHGTLMGNFLGNHDVERFSSVAAFQTNGDGCQAFNQALVPQPDDPTVYARIGVGFGFLLTVRGLPVIYYGDEFGLAGVKDPDNRRPMVFSDAQFSDAQKALQDLVARLNHARNAYPALRTGKYDAFHGEASCLAYVKAEGAQSVLVVLSGNAGCATPVTIKSGYGFDDGTVLRDVLYGEHQSTVNGGSVQMNLPPFQVRLFIAEN
jgi:glycosidase